MTTDLLFLRDAYERSRARRGDARRRRADRPGPHGVLPDRRRPAHDTGTLSWPGGSAHVTEVRKQGDEVWHTLEGGVPRPAPR